MGTMGRPSRVALSATLNLGTTGASEPPPRASGWVGRGKLTASGSSCIPLRPLPLPGCPGRATQSWADGCSPEWRTTLFEECPGGCRGPGRSLDPPFILWIPGALWSPDPLERSGPPGCEREPELCSISDKIPKSFWTGSKGEWKLGSPGV